MAAQGPELLPDLKHGPSVAVTLVQISFVPVNDEHYPGGTHPDYPFHTHFFSVPDCGYQVSQSESFKAVVF